MNLIEGYSLAWSSERNASPEASFVDDSQTDLATLVDTYSPLLFRVAYSVVRSRDQAEDVVQDVFLRVLQHRSNAHPSLESIRDPRVWLVRIAWNLALDRRRRIRPDQMDDLFAASLIGPGTPVDEALDEAQRLRSVLRELDRLPKAERQILLLSALEELSTAEIAAITARSESAVRALLFRARTRLRTRLDSRHPKGTRP
jgi:RNA polymerase sigma-70 factor (ECF subfamily)